MFVIRKTFQIEKGNTDELVSTFKERFKKNANKEIIGRIKNELHVSEFSKDHDEVIITSYWDERSNYLSWHKEAHANKKNGPLKEKPSFIIKVLVHQAYVVE